MFSDLLEFLGVNSELLLKLLDLFQVIFGDISHRTYIMSRVSILTLYFKAIRVWLKMDSGKEVDSCSKVFCCFAVHIKLTSL